MLYGGCLPRRLLRGLLPLFVLTFYSAAARAHEIPPGVLSCTPALPNFCANVHVGCAGRSKLRTSGFDVLVHKGRASVTFSNGTGWVAKTARSRGALILRRHGDQGWIRIETDGRFSQRIYVKGAALMAYGTCRGGKAL